MWRSIELPCHPEDGAIALASGQGYKLYLSSGGNPWCLVGPPGFTAQPEQEILLHLEPACGTSARFKLIMAREPERLRGEAPADCWNIHGGLLLLPEQPPEPGACRIDVRWIGSAEPAALFAGIERATSFQEQEAIERRLARAGRAVIPEARKALSASSWRTRESALFLLSELSDVAALPSITRLLTDSNKSVRLMARRALHHVLRMVGSSSRPGPAAGDLVRAGLTMVLNELFVSRCEPGSDNSADACRILESAEVDLLPFNLPSVETFTVVLRARSRAERKIRVVALAAPPNANERGRTASRLQVMVQPVRITGEYARVALSFEQVAFNSGSAWSVAFRRVGERWEPIDALPARLQRANGYHDPERHGTDLELGRLEALDLVMARKRLSPEEGLRSLDAKGDLGLGSDERLDPRYIPHLREYLADAGEVVRLSAAWGLLELGDEQGAALIANACRGADRQSRRGQWCWRQDPSMRHPPIARDELLEMMRESRKVRGCPSGDRWFGLQGTQHAPETLTHLRSIAMEEAEEDLRRKALEGLRYQRDPRLLPFWRAVLNEKGDPAWSGAALIGLASIGTPEALALFRAHLGALDPRKVQLFDLFRLLGVNHEAADELLLELARSNEPSIRAEALRALRLSAVRKPVPVDAILTGLRDSDPRVAEAALWLAHRRPVGEDAILLPTVAGLLRRSDRSLRRQAELWIRGTCSVDNDHNLGWWEARETLVERGEIEFGSAPMLAACLAGRFAWLGDMDRALEAARAALLAIRSDTEGEVPGLPVREQGPNMESHLLALVAVLEIRNGEEDAAARTLDLLDALPSGDSIPSFDPSRIDGILITGRRADVVARLRKMIANPLRLRLEPRTLAAAVGAQVRIGFLLENRSDSVILCEVEFDEAGKPWGFPTSRIGVNVYGMPAEDSRATDRREVALPTGGSVRFERRIWVRPWPHLSGITVSGEPRCRFDDGRKIELGTELVSARGQLRVE